MTRSIHPTSDFVHAPTASVSLLRRCSAVIDTFALCLSACREGLASSRRYDKLRARGIPHHLALVEALDEAARG